MSAEKTVRSGIKWPVCTLLLVIGLGALGYFGYSKFMEERAGTAAPAVSTPAQMTPGLKAPAPGGGGPSAAGVSAGDQAYRGVFPFYFLKHIARFLVRFGEGVQAHSHSLKDGKL